MSKIEVVTMSLSDYNKLKKEQNYARWWTMSDLEKATSKSANWIRENVLFQPHFKKILDVNNGGFVKYPEGKGSAWVFNAYPMMEFLENNFVDIFSNNSIKN